MGDVYENREAEQLVHGRIHRLQPDHESPQLDLGDVGEPVQRFTIATSGLATPQEFGWHGYELELAVDSTPGVAVGVAFSRADADTGRVQRLYPGERFSSVRPFRRVWLVSVGDAGSVVLHLTRVSLATRGTRQTEIISAGVHNSAIITGPAANQVLADTGELAAGIYDVQFIHNEQQSSGAVIGFQIRNAANDSSLWEYRRSFSLSLADHTTSIRRYEIPAGGRVRTQYLTSGTAHTVFAAVAAVRVG